MPQTSSSVNPARHPRLLDRVRAAIRTKHYSRSTEKAYVHWIKRFVLFHNQRHPDEMGEREIAQFITHLAVKERMAASTQNQALCALLFLYREVLGRKMDTVGNIVWAKRPQRLPTVLTEDEVRALLSHLSGAAWLMGNLLYGAGLRQMECLRLRVQDIDFQTNQLLVRDAKGRKDRVTVLPQKVKPALQDHLVKVKKLHESDLRQGYGTVYLPHALSRKYKHANREWRWQYVFPAPKNSYSATGTTWFVSATDMMRQLEDASQPWN